MADQGSSRRVLRFAVTGALLGGGAMAAGCKHQHGPNEAPVQEPEPHANPGPQEELHTNPGPEPDTAEPETPEPETPPMPDEPHVNVRRVDPPPAEPSGDRLPVIANPAPQPDPSK
ncbi:MAG: hypothetical protein KDK70_09580 [Myxococcales bacterium]|nr:hypothetical protein [Myxococcales bacterium]